MKVKNISARAHWVGSVMCVPGVEAEIDDAYANAINRDELVPVKDSASADAASAKSRTRGRTPRPTESDNVT